MRFKKLAALLNREYVTPKEDRELTQEIATPMIKIVGGEPDVRPSKALEMLGEQESPDIEEMEDVVDYEDYIKKKKRQMYE